MNEERTPWHSPPELWAKLQPPARQMRRAPTPEEDLVWERLRGRRFHGLRVRRQHALGPFIVDFYCSEKRFVLEVDGGVHETSVEKDAMRQEYLERRGFTVLRLLNREVNENPDRALMRVWETLNSLPSPLGEQGRGT